MAVALRVSSRPVDAAELPVGVARGHEEGWLELSISDTGLGIEQAEIDRVFEPFFTTKGEAGIGLGLANVFGIVAAAGGTVTVESQPGEGSTFRVYLPIVPAQDAPVRDVEHERDGSGSVLLVDDREDVREVLAAVLASGGHDVLVAKDVDAGIAVLNEATRPIDLLISDAIMPGRSVLDLIDAYENRCPAGAILICSGHINEDLLKRGIRAGDYSFLAKPFEPEELLTAVDTVLAEGSLQQGRRQNIPD